VVAAAGIVAAVVLANEPKHTLGALPPNSIGILDADGALHDAVPVGQNPDALVYGFGSLWVANSGERTVQRVNPKTHEVIQTFEVGPNPTAIALSAKNVWVANGSDGTVTEIDAATNRVVVPRIPVGAQPAALVVGPKGVWVANSGDDNLSLIDIDSARVVTTKQAGDGPDGLVVGGDSLWIANGADGTLSHLDARTGEPLGSARADAGATGLMLTEGALWVANKSASSVSQIDPPTGLVRGTIPVGDGPSSLALAHDAIWASNEYDGTISRIDPETKRAVHTYAVGASPHGMAVAGKDLWLASAAFANAAHVGGTLTYVATDANDLKWVDPATAYNFDFGIVTRPVYDGLVAYRATGGAAGAAIVPDLAVRLPRPTNGGRTYTFTIRSGVRFSNGDVVHASDVRRGIVRELTIGQSTGNPGLYRAIIGAPACIDHPKHCDLSAGVQVDDLAGRITFQLSEADPGFLNKLTLTLVVATPKDAPGVESAKPLAGTGPYQISEFRKGEMMVLRRNPYFRQWSYAAQPKGYPDVIRFVKPKSSQAPGIADILAGRADVMLVFGDEATNVYLRARYPKQFHEQVWFQTHYLTLNVHRPPFDQLGTRRAVNYAFDRRRFVEILGGEVAARPACQILPPGFPGHVFYCPYGGASFAPNVPLAQSIVKASGTAGMTVDVYGQHYAPEQLKYVASVLGDIGYRPVMHLLTDDNAVYMPFISDPSHRVDVAITPGWIPDYPRPDAYFDFLFSCRPPPLQALWDNNINRYCRPEVDELVAKAKSAQLSNPPEALARWALVDHLIVDDAPVVPTANAVFDAFTSTRVGNVQTTPVLPMLLGQMWVQ
jgi:YVTN family beta-propeller protein